MTKPKEPTKEEMLDCLECLIENTPCLEKGCVNPIHADWTFNKCEELCDAIRRLVEKYGDKQCEKNTIDNTEKKS